MSGFVLDLFRLAVGLAAASLMCLVPGWLITRHLDRTDPVLRGALSVVLSLSLTVAVSLALIGLGAWSWQLCAGVLALICAPLLIGASTGRRGGSPEPT